MQSCGCGESSWFFWSLASVPLLAWIDDDVCGTHCRLSFPFVSHSMPPISKILQSSFLTVQSDTIVRLACLFPICYLSGCHLASCLLPICHLLGCHKRQCSLGEKVHMRHM
jgi:hypothetical protein